MTAPAYPVAPTAEAALHGPAGVAARESEARAAAGAEVAFTSELVGPGFTTREAAELAYAPRLRGEAALWCSLRPVLPDGTARPAPARPAMKDGARWPSAPVAPAPLWRLSVSFWRVLGPDHEPALEPLNSARRLRRDPASAAGLDARALKRLSIQPLRAVRPQQPLDIGLFERALPETPGALIPDE